MPMDPVHPIYALLMVLIALATASLLVRRFGAPPVVAPFTTLEGLRGFAAFLVMVHHACFWFYYLYGHRWMVPPSNLYNQLGQVSVAVFFMITSLLFTNKLLEPKGLDWPRLYVSRFLRLVPMYALLLLGLVFFAFQQAGFKLLESPQQLWQELGAWLMFGFLGMPDINGLRDTFTVVAGVVWSLPYEVLFYLALPAMALFVWPWRRERPLVGTLIAALVSAAVVTLIWRNVSLDPVRLHIFVPGIVAAFVVRVPQAQAWFVSAPASIVALFCLFVVTIFFQTSFEDTQIALIGVAFTIIAAGNTLFGLLELPAARWLGRIGYSLYLLHGFTLFIAYRLLVKDAIWQPTWRHWGIAGICAVVVIVLASLTYRFVEAPSIAAVPRVHAWLLNVFRLGKGQPVVGTSRGE